MNQGGGGIKRQTTTRHKRKITMYILIVYTFDQN